MCKHDTKRSIEVLKFAQILSERGIGNGDLVAIFTSNSPEMVIAILAISRLGGIAPMINTNLRGIFDCQKQDFTWGMTEYIQATCFHIVSM